MSNTPSKSGRSSPAKRRTLFSAATGSLFAVILIGLGCHGRPSSPRPVTSEMYVHFAAARDMRTAAIFADIQQIRESAAEIARRGSVAGLPEGSASYLYELRQEAREIEETEDAETAVRETASLVRQCGLCHQSFAAGPGEQFVMREPPHGRGTERHAERLSWAVNRLWEGLLGPSETAWHAGADALADPGSFGPEMAEALGGDAATFEEALRELTRMSEYAEEFVADEDGTRVGAQILGEVFVTCASCHAGGL